MKIINLDSNNYFLIIGFHVFRLKFVKYIGWWNLLLPEFSNISELSNEGSSYFDNSYKIF